MELIDTHCHIDVPAFDSDRAKVLDHCRSLGITRLIVPGIVAKTWSSLKEICTSNPGLYPAFGLHPVYVDRHDKSDLDLLEKYLKNDSPIAVGEIGLDHYLTELDRDLQLEFFESQLLLAQTYSLPVILHARKCHDVMLSTLRRIRVSGGICHAFNGSLDQAHQYLDLGFKLGFGGMLTFERSHKLHRLAKQLPLDAIVLETDAPDMTGASHHGQRNSPEYLPESLTALASLRNESEEDIAAQTTANAEAIFSIR